MCFLEQGSGSSAPFAEAAPLFGANTDPPGNLGVSLGGKPQGCFPSFIIQPSAFPGLRPIHAEFTALQHVSCCPSLKRALKVRQGVEAGWVPSGRAAGLAAALRAEGSRVLRCHLLPEKRNLLII